YVQWILFALWMVITALAGYFHGSLNLSTNQRKEYCLHKHAELPAQKEIKVAAVDPVTILENCPPIPPSSSPILATINSSAVNSGEAVNSNVKLSGIIEDYNLSRLKF